jgi:glycosyltransferase involved in cell wall biosynthesis
MTMTTKVSVIVCTFNRCGSLAETLASLAALEVPEEIAWEVVVVDNNSTDGTREVVARFSRDAAVRTRYLFEPRQGLSHARNFGLAASDAEYVLFTDDDVLVDSGWLRYTVAALVDRHADCAGGKVLPLWRGNRPQWLGDRMLNVLAVLDYGDEVLELGGGTDDRILYGASLAFRREKLLAVGAFNPDLGRKGSVGTGEDMEIQEKLRQRAARIIYEPLAVVYHKIDPERLHKRYFRRWHYDAGRDRAKVVKPSRFTVMGIEDYLLREFLSTATKMLSAALQLRWNRLFELELRCILYLSVFKHKIGRAIFAAEA